MVQKQFFVSFFLCVPQSQYTVFVQQYCLATTKCAQGNPIKGCEMQIWNLLLARFLHYTLLFTTSRYYTWYYLVFFHIRKLVWPTRMSDSHTTSRWLFLSTFSYMLQAAKNLCFSNLYTDSNSIYLFFSSCHGIFALGTLSMTILQCIAQ